MIKWDILAFFGNLFLFFRSPLDGVAEKRDDARKRRATFILDEIDDDPILQSPIDVFQVIFLDLLIYLDLF